MKRRSLLLAASAAAALATGTPARAADPFPSKPVTLVTPFAPGSGPDAVLRLVAEKLGKVWNQRVVVDNKPGGGGFIAIEAARRAPADGHTLLQLDSEHLTALPLLYKSRNFETLKVFTPVAPLFRTHFFVAVKTESPLKSMAEFISAAKAAPQPLSVGSWGIGSAGHLGAEQLELLTGAQFQHVPFREVSQLYTSVGSGDVGWAFGTLPSSRGAFQAGKLRYIAVAAPKRVPQMPHVPTVAESGGPAALDVNSFVSLVAPQGIAPELRTKIHADVQKALADPELRERFASFAFEPLDWNAAEIERQAAIKSRIFGELVKRKSISLE